MKSNYRQTMHWIHTWSGLIVGWLLFIIFVTGTSSYYRPEITLWMQAELHKSKSSEKTFDIAIQKVLEASEKSISATISLPNSRNNAIRLITKNSNNKQKDVKQHNQSKQTQKNDNKALSQKEKMKKMKRKRRGVVTYFDANTGELIKPRATAGGDFIYRFHFELYKLPRSQGRLIVAIATMIMFIAIISGIIIHKRIFKDMFTFRPKAGPRGWMDAHIIPAVAALPFLIMITYSGLLLLNNSLLPWSMKALYGDNFMEYKMDKMALIKKANSSEQNKVNAVKEIASDNFRNMQRILNTKAKKDFRTLKSSGLNARQLRDAKRVVNTNIKRVILEQEIKSSVKRKDSINEAELKKILNKADKIWPNNIGYFSIVKKENSTLVEVRPKDPTTIFSFKGEKELAVFDARSAKLIKQSTPPFTNSGVMNTYTAFISLHMALFADSTLRFIFFIFGLSGVVLCGTGLILWTKKREHKNSKKKSLGFWLVEKLNLGTIMGIMIAIGVYFIASRFIPTDEPARKILEINAFFMAWGISFLHAFLRETSKAWREQLWFAIRLYILIPIVNAIIVFDSFSTIFNRDSILLYFDLFFVITAFIFFIVLSILRKKAKAKEQKCQ